MVKPTIKQKVAFKNIMENHGNISKGMRAAGYDDTTAKNPKNLTNSEGWKQLMEEYFPDEDLVRIVKEGLSATRVISAVNANKQAIKATTDFIDVPDFPSRHRYLETALKLKKKLTDRLDLTSSDKPFPVPIYGGKSYDPK